MTMQLPPLPEPIGEICGRRLTPPDTLEFWGYFAQPHGQKERVYTAAQMQSYATLACKERDALIADLSQALQAMVAAHESFMASLAPAVAAQLDDPLVDAAKRGAAALAKVPK